MSAFRDVYDTFIVDDGFTAFMRVGVIGFGENGVELDYLIEAVAYLVDAHAHFQGERSQYAFYLLLFGNDVSFQGVVQLHYRHRLDVQRLPRSRLVVNEPRNGASAFRFHRYHVSVAAHRDDIVLQIFGIRRRSYIRIQLGLDCFASFADTHTYLPKILGRPVVHFRFGNDRVIDLVLQIFIRI